MTKDIKLVVVSPFGKYKRGDYITEQEEVKKYLHSSHVRRAKHEKKEDEQSDADSGVEVKLESIKPDDNQTQPQNTNNKSGGKTFKEKQ